MKTLTKKQRALRNNLTAWILVAPSLIFMLVFTVYPVFRSIYLSLTRYRLGMQAPEFVGLENYINLFGSSLFWKVMGNTLFFALITIIPSMAAGLFLATLVNRKSRSIGFVRTAFFYPVVMPMIAIASIWMFIYMAKNGLFDQMLVSLGLEPMNVLSNKSTVLPAMAVMYVWKEAGYLMVFFLSGIQSISDEVNEAARIDGATKWQQIKCITLPLLKPTVITLFILSVGQIFRSDFGLFYQMPRNSGSLYSVTRTLDVYIYQALMKNNDYSMSSAASVYQSIVGFVLIIGANKLVKKYESGSALF